MKDAPFTHFYNLGRLPQIGETIAIIPTEVEREALARWLDIAGIEKWHATVVLKKLSPTRFGYEVALTADLVQTCVVTLVPVPAHIERVFARELRFTGDRRHRGSAPEPGSVPFLADEDEPEEIECLRYDLAAPLIEEFSLALDPYPRAPGAAFESPTDPQPDPLGSSENPFMVLRGLKSGH